MVTMARACSRIGPTSESPTLVRLAPEKSVPALKAFVAGGGRVLVLEQAGAFAIVLEAIPPDLAAQITGEGEQRRDVTGAASSRQQHGGGR